MLPKKILSSLSATLALGLFLACGGASTPSASTVPHVYAGGFQTLSGFVPGYWLDGEWVELPAPTGPSSTGEVYAMAASGGDLYAAGWSGSPLGVQEHVGYWRNRAWVELPLASQVAASLHAIAVTGSNVYVAGETSENGGPWTPGYWKGGQWNALAMPAGANGWVSSLALSGTDVYVGGSIDGNALRPAPGYWKNGAWIELPTPQGSATGFVTALAVSGPDVYVTGRVDGKAGIWSKGSWSVLASDAFVNSVVVSGSEVLVGGQAADAAGRWLPGYWRNGAWVALPLPAGADGGSVYGMTVQGKDVYAAGYVTLPSGANPPPTVAGYWRNGIWVGLSNPAVAGVATVHALVVQP